MNTKIKTDRKIINSTKQNFNDDYLFLNQSMVENKSNEVCVSCKEVSFVVEWQMHNPIPEFS